MTPEKLIDRIKKLLAKANDESVTQAEAAAFAAKAAELAAREAIELSELDWENRREEVPVGTYRFWPEEHDIARKKRRTAWMEQLCAIVCRSQGTEIVVIPRSNSFDIVGRRENVKIAAYLCAYLVRFVLNMSERDYGAYFRQCAREGRVTAARGFKASWRNGFVNEVHRRIKEMKKQLELEYAQSTALVRLKTELDDVEDWMKDNYKTKKGSALQGRRGGNAKGYEDGKRAGRHVDLSGRALDNEPTDRGKLT